jgi:hypothetical protein
MKLVAIVLLTIAGLIAFFAKPKLPRVDIYVRSKMFGTLRVGTREQALEARRYWETLPSGFHISRSQISTTTYVKDGSLYLIETPPPPGGVVLSRWVIVTDAKNPPKSGTPLWPKHFPAHGDICVWKNFPKGRTFIVHAGVQCNKLVKTPYKTPSLTSDFLEEQNCYFYE